MASELEQLIWQLQLDLNQFRAQAAQARAEYAGIAAAAQDAAKATTQAQVESAAQANAATQRWRLQELAAITDVSTARKQAARDAANQSLQDIKDLQQRGVLSQQEARTLTTATKQQRDQELQDITRNANAERLAINTNAAAQVEANRQRTSAVRQAANDEAAAQKATAASLVGQDTEATAAQLSNIQYVRAANRQQSTEVTQFVQNRMQLEKEAATASKVAEAEHAQNLVNDYRNQVNLIKETEQEASRLSNVLRLSGYAAGSAGVPGGRTAGLLGAIGINPGTAEVVGGAAGLATVGAGVAGAGLFAASTLEAAKYDDQLKQTQAVTQATDEQTKQLAQTIISGFGEARASLIDTAKASTELGNAGVSTQEQLQGVLKAVVDLSQASGGSIGLSGAVDLMVQSLRTFNLDATQAAQVANTLAAVSNKSTLNFADLKNGLTTVGETAHTLGLTLDQTVALLGALGDAGLKGSAGGSALMQFLSQLNRDTSTAAPLLEKLNIQLYNTNGTLKPVPDILEQFKTSLGDSAIASGQLTKQEQELYLQELFNTRAFKASADFVNNGADSYNKLLQASKDVTASGLSAQAADDASGSFNKLTRSISGLLATMGQSTQGPLKNFLDTLTAITQQLTKAAGSPTGQAALGSIVTSIIPGGNAISTAVDMLHRQSQALDEVNPRLEIEQAHLAEASASTDAAATATNGASDALASYVHESTAFIKIQDDIKKAVDAANTSLKAQQDAAIAQAWMKVQYPNGAGIAGGPVESSGDFQPHGNILGVPSSSKIAGATGAAIRAGANPAWLEQARSMLGAEDYINYCEKFVDDMEGVTDRTGRETAVSTAQMFQSQGLLRTDLPNMAPGNRVYFTPTAQEPAGHVGFYSGGGKFISATNAGVEELSLSDWTKFTGQQVMGFYSGGPQTGPSSAKLPSATSSLAEQIASAKQAENQFKSLSKTASDSFQSIRDQADKAAANGTDDMNKMIASAQRAAEQAYAQYSDAVTKINEEAQIQMAQAATEAQKSTDAANQQYQKRLADLDANQAIQKDIQTRTDAFNEQIAAEQRAYDLQKQINNENERYQKELADAGLDAKSQQAAADALKKQETGRLAGASTPAEAKQIQDQYALAQKLEADSYSSTKNHIDKTHQDNLDQINQNQVNAVDDANFQKHIQQEQEDFQAQLNAEALVREKVQLQQEHDLQLANIQTTLADRQKAIQAQQSKELTDQQTTLGQQLTNIKQDLSDQLDAKQTELDQEFAQIQQDWARRSTELKAQDASIAAITDGFTSQIVAQLGRITKAAQDARSAAGSTLQLPPPTSTSTTGPLGPMPTTQPLDVGAGGVASPQSVTNNNTSNTTNYNLTASYPVTQPAVTVMHDLQALVAISKS